MSASALSSSLAPVFNAHYKSFYEYLQARINPATPTFATDSSVEISRDLIQLTSRYVAIHAIDLDQELSETLSHMSIADPIVRNNAVSLLNTWKEHAGAQQTRMLEIIVRLDTLGRSLLSDSCSALRQKTQWKTTHEYSLRYLLNRASLPSYASRYIPSFDLPLGLLPSFNTHLISLLEHLKARVCVAENALAHIQSDLKQLATIAETISTLDPTEKRPELIPDDPTNPRLATLIHKIDEYRAMLPMQKTRMVTAVTVLQAQGRFLLSSRLSDREQKATWIDVHYWCVQHILHGEPLSTMHSPSMSVGYQTHHSDK